MSQLENDRLLDEYGTAEYINASVHCIRKWRCSGKGRPFLKIGKNIRYRKSVVDEWLREREYQSTSQYPTPGRVIQSPIPRKCPDSIDRGQSLTLEEEFHECQLKIPFPPNK